MTGLAGVRWIGGGSGAGKSTVAAMLGLPVVQTDLSLQAHAETLAGDQDVDAFVRMSMDERWLDRSPQDMLATFPWFTGAGFDLLLDEVRAMTDPTVVVEGFRLLPRVVAPLLAGGGRAVWLLPTAAMRERAFAGRAAEGRAFWERTADPARALANVLERDRLFTERLREECAELGLAALDVDGTLSAAAVADRVESLLLP